MYPIRGEATTLRAAVRPMSTENDVVSSRPGPLKSCVPVSYSPLLGTFRRTSDWRKVPSSRRPSWFRPGARRSSRSGRCAPGEGFPQAGVVLGAVTAQDVLPTVSEALRGGVRVALRGFRRSGRAWRTVDVQAAGVGLSVLGVGGAAVDGPGPVACPGGSRSGRTSTARRAAPSPPAPAPGVPCPSRSHRAGSRITVPWPPAAGRGRQEVAPRRGRERPGRSGFGGVEPSCVRRPPESPCRSASTTYGHPLPGELLSNHPHPHLFALRTVEALHKTWRAGWSPSPRSPSTPESRRAR